MHLYTYIAMEFYHTWQVIRIESQALYVTRDVGLIFLSALQRTKNEKGYDCVVLADRTMAL